MKRFFFATIFAAAGIAAVGIAVAADTARTRWAYGQDRPAVVGAAAARRAVEPPFTSIKPAKGLMPSLPPLKLCATRSARSGIHREDGPASCTATIGRVATAHRRAVKRSPHVD